MLTEKMDPEDLNVIQMEFSNIYRNHVTNGSRLQGPEEIFLKTKNKIDFFVKKTLATNLKKSEFSNLQKYFLTENIIKGLDKTVGINFSKKELQTIIDICKNDADEGDIYNLQDKIDFLLLNKDFDKKEMETLRKICDDALSETQVNQEILRAKVEKMLRKIEGGYFVFGKEN